MRIKTFQGRSLEELLPQIREELGPSAVVLGQRAKVQGGVAGFFGTRVVEVTAADRMPDDNQLVDLEDQLVQGDLVAASSRATVTAGAGSTDAGDGELADRFRGAMRMGRVGGLDVTDEWDPSQDAELANEYGKVLEHAAAAGFAELDVPTVTAPAAPQPAATYTPISTQPELLPTPAAAAAPVAASMPPAPHPGLDPAVQAELLAARAHAHMQQTTARVEGAQNGVGAYAPPRAMPRTTAPTHQTFAASVHDSPAIFDAPAVASQIVDPLREDLGLGPVPTAASPSPADPISAALDLIDLRAVEALRTAVDASIRIEQQQSAVGDGRPELRGMMDALTETGVDQDVVAELAHRVAGHRLPFLNRRASVDDLVRDVAGELVSVRSGYDRTSGTHTLAVVGASSSGKTTVVAQLANAYKLAGQRVGVVVLVSTGDPSTPIVQDRRLVGLGIDLRYVTTPDHAALAVQAFAGHDLVLVDTPGATWADTVALDHVQACFDALGVDDVHVVVPLATSRREAASVVERFRPLGANRVVVSRVNETHYLGQLLNLGFCLGMPMSFLSDDAEIETGLVPASTREIVDRIMPSDAARTAATNHPEESAL